MGVGIVAGLAYDADRDRNLRVISVSHLFGSNVTHLGVKQGAYLRSFVFTFIELFSPTLTKKIVEQAMNSDSETYEI
jgi:LysR family cys regulon transcriptional activator